MAVFTVRSILLVSTGVFAQPVGSAVWRLCFHVDAIAVDAVMTVCGRPVKLAVAVESVQASVNVVKSIEKFTSWGLTKDYECPCLQWAVRRFQCRQLQPLSTSSGNFNFVNTKGSADAAGKGIAGVDSDVDAGVGVGAGGANAWTDDDADADADADLDAGVNGDVDIWASTRMTMLPVELTLMKKQIAMARLA
ncbi:unnamed protein product [Phytophthora lilii]|uniref:Unnamed protein product n=1 Tax=Phytophthora lilii TaxID=2077276 RepID=A0A9W7CXC5_9STRA|nr:unnamed protein product [Phytophthora lilii]